MFNKIKRLFFSKRGTTVASGDGVSPTFSFNLGKEKLVPIFDYKGAVRMYKTNPLLAGCANLNAKTVSSLPLKLFAWTKGRTVKEMESNSPWRLKPLSRKTRAFLSGDLNAKPSQYAYRKYIDMGGDFVEVEGMHPIMRLLGQGAAEYRQSITNGTQQTMGRILDLQLTGNYYLQVVFSGGIPVDLWIAPASNMTIEPYKTGEKLIKNYFWGENENTRVKLKPEEIIQGKLYNPDGNDLYYGQSMVEPAWIACNWLKSLDEYEMALFKNMGIPALFAKLSGATKDQLTRFERNYWNKMRGPENAGKLLAHSNDIEFVTPSFSRGKDTLTDSIPVSYEHKVTEICFALGIPVSRFLSNDTNLASAFINDAAYRRDTIAHICYYDSATLNQYLLPLFGLEEENFLQYENIIPKDEEKIETRLISLKNAGIISAETVRNELGYDESNAPEVPTQLQSEPKIEDNKEDNKDEGERDPRGSNFEEDEDKKDEKEDNTEN